MTEKSLKLTQTKPVRIAKEVKDEVGKMNSSIQRVVLFSTLPEARLNTAGKKLREILDHVKVITIPADKDIVVLYGD